MPRSSNVLESALQRNPDVTSPSSIDGSQEAGDRLAVLDGLRLVAALMVVVFHYTVNAEPWGKPVPPFHRTLYVTGYGGLGVELFFVISGFVICMSAWGRGLGRFFVSRVVRLFPAYWFGVLFTTVMVAVLLPGRPRPGSADVLANLTMLQKPMGIPNIDAVYWTLWEELHFYLLFALIVWRGLTYRRVVLFCLLWTVASVLVATSSGPVLHLAVGDGMSYFFVAGMALYLVYRFGSNLLLWGIVGVSWALGLNQLRSIVNPGISVRWIGIVAVITGIFAIMAAVALRWLNWIRGRWLIAAGALTYPLYLMHLRIGHAVLQRLHSHVPKWPLIIGLIAAMLVAAWLVHRFVERPLAPLVKRWLTDAMTQMRRAG
jgi:peptidoglycan/LPS O-acetylase OafA/YrhL